ncbi:hypothetical protein PV08_10144 [Exophiala spinifera]|uniref:FAD-binding PCMH-type domain-containing protein n=1 Tax=Exophiala spinifera TaxID=91928 RepID=A0A0D2AWI2_9EURO|nr:uncharacterized protein PV08_10144 [Exophiala spinifera]KIW10845.1 hypothetical protein PV08_10144 [Exophiala spinifera]
MSSRTLPVTPTLEDKHSGIPSRLVDQAKRAKELLFSRRTKTENTSSSKRGVQLPPYTTQAKFDDAIAALKAAVGDHWVHVNDGALVDGWYMEHPNTHDSNHVANQDALVASAVVYPSTTEEVQGIVKWANEFLIPIHPISMGRNLGYGGAAPRVSGSVVVDLGKRMNKVLKIDGQNCSCLLEPGVSYFALYEAVKKSGHSLWIDCPDLGGGSVMGNALDRGVGYTPYGDHFGMHCGMEVVLPDGTLLRTGMGALPGEDDTDNLTWQSFQNAYGPAIDGMFSQSNYGIVTKMGFWLMPATGSQSYMVTFPREDDFEQLVDLIGPLAASRVFGNVPQIRHVVQELAVTGKPRSHFWPEGSDRGGRMPRSIISREAAKLPCGDVSWIFYGCQYGDAATIQAQLDLIKTTFAKIKGSKFFLPSDLPNDHYIHDRAKVNIGEPVLKELDWLNWLPNGGHIACSPILPTSGKHARTMMTIAERLYAKWGFDSFSTLCVAGREMHFIAEIVFDREDADSKRRAACLMRELIDEGARKGYGEYRTHLLYMDQVAGTYKWGNGALGRFNETIKDALDPNGIISPGRNGIWGKRWREKGWKSGQVGMPREVKL